MLKIKYIWQIIFNYLTFKDQKSLLLTNKYLSTVKTNYDNIDTCIRYSKLKENCEMIGFRITLQSKYVNKLPITLKRLVIDLENIYDLDLAYLTNLKYLAIRMQTSHKIKIISLPNIDKLKIVNCHTDFDFRTLNLKKLIVKDSIITLKHIDVRKLKTDLKLDYNKLINCTSLSVKNVNIKKYPPNLKKLNIYNNYGSIISNSNLVLCDKIKKLTIKHYNYQFPDFSICTNMKYLELCNERIVCNLKLPTSLVILKINFNYENINIPINLEYLTNLKELYITNLCLLPVFPKNLTILDIQSKTTIGNINLYELKKLKILKVNRINLNC